jgi:hypothetical protein
LSNSTFREWRVFLNSPIVGLKPHWSKSSLPQASLGRAKRPLFILVAKRPLEHHHGRRSSRLSPKFVADSCRWCLLPPPMSTHPWSASPPLSFLRLGRAHSRSKPRKL